VSWDTAWKAVAIRRALKNGHRAWVPVLALVNSAGLLPMLFLALTRPPIE
jgi:hypothetical protein